MESEDIIRSLKKYRKDHKMNQAGMAATIGVSFRSYQDIERTGVVKKSDVIKKINELTGTQKEQKIANTDLENEIALRQLIDNERIIVDTNARLVAMLEKVMNPTVTNLEGILTGISATIQGIADTVVEVAAGAKYPSKEAAANKLHKNISTHQEKRKTSDTLSAAGR